MPITTKCVICIYNAEQEIEEQEKLAKGFGNAINKAKQSIQDNNQEAIAKIAREYLRIQPNNPLSNDIDRVKKLIDIYEKDLKDCQNIAEDLKRSFQQFKEDHENLYQELKELKEKLENCSNSGHTIEICQRLENFTEQWILTMETSCQERLTKCRALFLEDLTECRALFPKQ